VPPRSSPSRSKSDRGGDRSSSAFVILLIDHILLIDRLHLVALCRCDRKRLVAVHAAGAAPAAGM
jgi:hypothetical protein